MKKFFLILTLQLSCTAVYSVSHLECRIEELERQVQQLRVVTPNETCGANTALARPILDIECGCCGSNFFVESSVLYWHAKVSGTEFASGTLAIKTVLDPSEVEVNIGSVKGCLQSIDLCWNWGFKIGLGYNLPYDGWDISLNYTAFNAKGHKSVYADKENAYIINYKLYPVATIARTPKELTSLLSKKAKSKLCLELDALEFDLGRAFYISNSVVIYPKIGIKAFWIEFKQNTCYRSVVLISSVVEDPERREPFVIYGLKDTNKFSGVGPHFVLGTEWHFCDNFYLYGSVSGSLLYGLFTTHHKEKITFSKENEEEVLMQLFSFKNRMCQSRRAFVPIVDSQIGIAYGNYFHCDRMHLTLRLAYDT